MSIQAAGPRPSGSPDKPDNTGAFSGNLGIDWRVLDRKPDPRLSQATAALIARIDRLKDEAETVINDSHGLAADNSPDASRIQHWRDIDLDQAA